MRSITQLLAVGFALTSLSIAEQPIGFRGSEKAPVTVMVFSDFESFPCSRSAAVVMGIIEQSRDVRLIFKHAPAASNPNALLAHEAALAAGTQGKFWEMHDMLFTNQQHLTRADLIGYAKQIGLNLPAFEQALDRHNYRAAIERDLAEARALGVTTTPTFFVNGRRLVGSQGYSSLGAVIETVLAGIPESQRVPVEIVASGPAQQINLERAPSKGPATAPVSLVEFSDFECPFCARVAPTVQQLLAAYPTQLRLAFKHYPLTIHKGSALAHEASLAAGAQGQFWEMYDALFASQDKLTRDDLIAKVDATLHLDMLIRHPDKLRPFNPDTPETRAIQLLTEDRRQLVDERTRLSNRLGADLKSYFPQLLQWFEDPYSPVVLDLLERWPSLEELQRAKPATLRKFFREHRCRDEAKNEERLENIRKAVALTTDFAVTTAGRAAASAAVRLLRELGRSIREYDRQIEELTVAHSDYLIFASLPGAGQVLIPRLIAGFGTRRDRYQNAAELQQFSGIAPVTEASGQQCWVHWRWCCPKFLRQTFHEWAAQTIQHCDWAAAYYRAQRDDKKKSHHAAVRSLAYKWIRIVFRCWKDRIPYDDAKYEATLKSRAKTTPVAKPTSAFELPIRWTSCGSFQKVALKNA